jgi:hypothetical protein
MTPPADPARYKNHRFPGEIISHGVWLYYRFPLSYRDVQELLFERGIDVTHEAIRQWCLKFGRDYANQLKHRRPQPGDKWHLDEVFLKCCQLAELLEVEGAKPCMRDQGTSGEHGPPMLRCRTYLSHLRAAGPRMFLTAPALVCPIGFLSGPYERLLRCGKLAIRSLEHGRLPCSASLCTPVALPGRDGVARLRCSASLDARQMALQGATSHREAA